MNGHRQIRNSAARPEIIFSRPLRLGQVAYVASVGPQLQPHGQRTSTVCRAPTPMISVPPLSCPALLCPASQEEPREPVIFLPAPFPLSFILLSST